MFRKIALCAMLVLILTPAAVMAAGQQGQAQGIGNEAGNGLHVQQKITSETMAQTWSCDQACEQDKARVRNMTQDQVRLNADAGPANENKGAGSDGAAKMLQTRSCDQVCEQDRARIQNMTRDQVRLDSDSFQQQDGSAVSVQNRFGLAKGNGQNILTSFGDQLGARIRHVVGLVHITGQ